MKKKILVFAFSCVALATDSFAQFIVKNTFFETNDVSNQGLVVGYSEWGGPYSIWTPTTQGIDTIYGLAPGNGIGGRAMFSNDGNYLSGTSNGVGGAQLSRYDIGTGTWTALGSLGFAVDGTQGGGYAIAGDGNTVVGNSWVDTTGGIAATDAVAWNATEGFMDLGTLFPGRSTRANAVSGDGSVVVGWQDFNGPWKSAVWRKNPVGGYFANEYLLLDPNGSASDENNQMGECSAVSVSGLWIGGQGDWVTNGNPWIWSQATGVIDLGTLAAGAQGYVAALNQDGTVAVGRFQQGAWDPELPFIWTPAGGIQNVNDYIHNTLGLSTGSKVVYSANCMSPNGQYIAGYGVDTVSFEYFTYIVSTVPLSIGESTINTLSVYPNPVTDVLTLQNNAAAKLTITDLGGKKTEVLRIEPYATVNTSSFEAGVYLLTIESLDGKTRSTVRIVKK